MNGSPVFEFKFSYAQIGIRMSLLEYWGWCNLACTGYLVAKGKAPRTSIPRNRRRILECISAEDSQFYEPVKVSIAVSKPWLADQHIQMLLSRNMIGLHELPLHKREEYKRIEASDLIPDISILFVLLLRLPGSGRSL